MLFSNDAIARMLQESFEPVWESVRPVPVLTLDFGNGRVLTRTLHGNIASYVCTAEGTVLDVLPGIYDAASFSRQIDQLRLLHTYWKSKDPAAGDTALRDYHLTQAAALAKNMTPGHFVAGRDVSKVRIERPAKDLMVRFVPPRPGAARAPTPTVARTAVKPDRRDVGKGVSELPAKKFVAGSADDGGAARPGHDADVARWTELLQDTQINEQERRLQIHQRLAGATATPRALTKWLYAEVLHADLDDPYLGLGPILTGDYPFEVGKSER